MAVSCIYMTGPRKRCDIVVRKKSEDLPPAANLDAKNDLSIRTPGEMTERPGRKGLGTIPASNKRSDNRGTKGDSYLLLVILVL